MIFTYNIMLWGIAVGFLSFAFMVLDGLGMASSGLVRVGIAQSVVSALVIFGLLVAWRSVNAKKLQLQAKEKQEKNQSNQSMEATGPSR